jgi:hypothetical protein
MSSERIFREMNWAPEDRARHKAVRERFQRERPSLQQLVESGDCAPPIPQWVYWSIRPLVVELKKAREAAGLSLAEVAERSGIEVAALSELERGFDFNPTASTLARYAAALGKRLTWTLQDLPAEPARGR